MRGGERSCILFIDEQGHEKTHQIIGWYLLKIEPEKCQNHHSHIYINYEPFLGAKSLMRK